MVSDPLEPRARTIAQDLIDVRCRSLLTPRLVPWLNVGMVSGLVYALGWLVFACFERSLWLGLAHLVVVAPVGLVVGAMFVRALLECGVAVLQIRDRAEELGDLPRRLSSWPAMRRIVALGESRTWITRERR